MITSAYLPHKGLTWFWEYHRRGFRAKIMVVSKNFLTLDRITATRIIIDDRYKDSKPYQIFWFNDSA